MTYRNILNAITEKFKQKMKEFCENDGKETCETPFNESNSIFISSSFT